MSVLAVVTALGVQAMQPTDETIFDFRDGGQAWPSIDDVVMGGVSSSEMAMLDGAAVFRGTVSLENNGGFASLRSQPAHHDLSGFDGVTLRVRGDGKRYGFRLRTTAAFDGVSYEVRFTAPDGEWVELQLRFVDFEPVFRGRRVPGHPPLDPSEIMSFGLIISDKQAGPFMLEIEWIQGFTGRP
jgi:monofunctional biosynthetic peptidoglycan transglycosylase